MGFGTKNYTNEGMMDCYCGAIFSKYWKSPKKGMEIVRFTEEKKDNEKLRELMKNHGNPCVKWLKDTTIRKVIEYGAVVGISVMNTVLRAVLSGLSNFEAKHTETERLTSSVSKMWIVQYLNTAVVLLLIGTMYEKVFNTKI